MDHKNHDEWDLFSKVDHRNYDGWSQSMTMDYRNPDDRINPFNGLKE